MAASDITASPPREPSIAEHHRLFLAPAQARTGERPVMCHPTGPPAPVSPREGQRAELAAARTRHGQGVSLQRVTALMVTKASSAPHATSKQGTDGSLTGRAGWWQRGGCRAASHLRGADAALHTHCRHPAQLWGSCRAGGPARPRIRPGDIAERTRAACSHTPPPHTLLHRLDNALAPFHPSLALHRR